MNWENTIRLVVVAAVLSLNGVTFGKPGGTDTNPEWENIAKCRAIDSPGTYRVINDLVARYGEDCLVIASDNVSLDLNGHSILANPEEVLQSTCSGPNGITDGEVQRNSIAIRDGSVTRFCRGIFLSASPGVILEQVRVFDNARHGMSLGSASHVSNNIAYNNGLAGIRVGLNSNIINNISNNNGAQGIVTFNGSRVTGNTTNGNRAGISLSGSGHSLISGNIAYENESCGIFAVCPTNTVGNISTGNGTDESLSVEFRADYCFSGATCGCLDVPTCATFNNVFGAVSDFTP